MDYIIQLLKDRNVHLEKFTQLNESEMIRFDEGNFENLENFYKSREGILNLVACIDRLIEETECDPILPDSGKKTVLNLLSEKNDIVTEILSQDLQILSMIERAKSGIIRELTSLKSGRKALNNYRSNPAPKRIDEKY